MFFHQKILVIGFIFTFYISQNIYLYTVHIVIPKISQNNGKVNDDVLEIKIDDCHREKAIYTQ